MENFLVVVMDQSGAMARRELRASSAEEAIEMAGSSGDRVMECTGSKGVGAIEGRTREWFQRAPAAVDSVSFSQDMATMLSAGVTVKEACHALRRKESSPGKQEVFGALLTAINSGRSLSSALRLAGGFPELLVATIAASEETGDLPTGLSRYAKHQQNLKSVRDKLVAACVYPLMLVVVGAAVVALLLGVVVPRFAMLIDEGGHDLPYLSKLLMMWGRTASGHPAYAVTAFAAIFLLVAMFIHRLRNAEFRKRVLACVPGFASVARDFQHLQMYRTTAILTARGITVQKALLHSHDLLGPRDSERLAAALESLREGAGLSAALASTGLADVVAASMLNVAERTGSLPQMLDRIADFYEQSLQRKIDIFSRLIEPTLMILFGVVIGGIVILMYLPIFDLASSVN
jgi:general secretion pathway protein F